jgi:hypothetical protein
VSFPQLFAKGKSLKSVGIDMPQDKYKGLHGDMGHVEPIEILDDHLQPKSLNLPAPLNSGFQSNVVCSRMEIKQIS